MFPSRRFDRTTALFVSLLAISFVVATFDVRADGHGPAGVLREGAQTLFAPAQRAVDVVVRPVLGFVDGVADLAGLRDENARLRARVAELERQVLETEALRRRLAELEAISGLESPGELATVTARVFAGGAGPFDQIRYVDRGSADGLVPGQAVVDEYGFVGRVDQVSANHARIRLVSDPLVSVGVRDQQTNETGIVSGIGGGELRLEMFRATQPVREGDVLVTDGSRYPPGIVVGFVTETARADAGFVLRAAVEPAVPLSEVDFVKIVVGWSPLDASLEETEVVVEVPAIPGTEP